MKQLTLQILNDTYVGKCIEFYRVNNLDGTNSYTVEKPRITPKARHKGIIEKVHLSVVNHIVMVNVQACILGTDYSGSIAKIQFKYTDDVVIYSVVPNTAIQLHTAKVRKMSIDFTVDKAVDTDEGLVVVSIDDFIEDVMSGLFTINDGHGNYCIKGLQTSLRVDMQGFDFQIADNIRDWAKAVAAATKTKLSNIGIVWYNK